MSINRYAKRIDANQAEVISALQAAGAQVLVLSKPVDLLIGIAGRLALFEVKDGKKVKSAQEPTTAQKKFMSEWSGYPICTVDGPEAAIQMLNVIKRGGVNPKFPGESQTKMPLKDVEAFISKFNDEINRGVSL